MTIIELICMHVLLHKRKSLDHYKDHNAILIFLFYKPADKELQPARGCASLCSFLILRLKNKQLISKFRIHGENLYWVLLQF